MTAALNHIMKKTLYLLSLLLAVIATSCGGDSQIGKNFNEIEGASSSYRIRDQKNGEEYQVITLQTIPNKEYTITSANGKKRTFVDDEPLNLLGIQTPFDQSPDSANMGRKRYRNPSFRC